jgi:hypothetical protein
MTGAWPRPPVEPQAASHPAAWEAWRVTRAEVESATVRSLHLAIADGLGRVRMRPTTLVCATRQVADWAFDAELAELRQRAGNAIRLVRVTNHPETGTTVGQAFEAQGRIDLAELMGITPEFSCRAGSSGTCRTRVIKGQVSYAPPFFKLRQTRP